MANYMAKLTIRSCKMVFLTSSLMYLCSEVKSAVKQQRSVVAAVKIKWASSFGKPQNQDLRAGCVDTIMLLINKDLKHI